MNRWNYFDLKIQKNIIVDIHFIMKITMEYELITDRVQLEGTCYFEFLPGKYENKCWGEYSAYLTEDSLVLIEELLIQVNPYYDHYSVTEFSSRQINQFTEELAKAIAKIEMDKYSIASTIFSDDYIKKLNKNLRAKKNEVIELVTDLKNWMEQMIQAYDTITVIGI